MKEGKPDYCRLNLPKNSPATKQARLKSVVFLKNVITSLSHMTRFEYFLMCFKSVLKQIKHAPNLRNDGCFRKH